jgi:ABC-2 type transport system permease protein
LLLMVAVAGGIGGWRLIAAARSADPAAASPTSGIGA